MFIGHAATGFAAKRLAPTAPLPWLLAAPWLLDLLWPVFLLTGVEHVKIAPGTTAFTPLDFTDYPWSHSLLMALVWGALFGLAYRAVTRDARGAWVVGALVPGHWVLDLLVHRPDLQLAPGLATRVGLGLWNSVPGTIAVEGALYVAGFAIYLGTTRGRGIAGVIAPWSLGLALAAIYALDVVGPPPPSVAPIAWITLAFGAVIVLWGTWVERARPAREFSP